MSKYQTEAVNELETLLDAYSDEYYNKWAGDEELQETDEDTGEYPGSLGQAWDKMYTGYIGDGYKEVPKPFDYELPGVGTVRVIDDYDSHDDGHTLYVVFEWNGHTFQYEGWDDSWGGDGGWEGPLREVIPYQFTTTKYRVVE